jgi:hypothetical protein
MAKPHHVNNAKSVVAILILAIFFVIFYKFMTNQMYFSQDPNALFNYVIFAIIGAGFLIGLLYLTSKSPHKESGKIKAIKPSKIKKKKK